MFHILGNGHLHSYSVGEVPDTPEPVPVFGQVLSDEVVCKATDADDESRLDQVQFKAEEVDMLCKVARYVAR